MDPALTFVLAIAGGGMVLIFGLLVVARRRRRGFVQLLEETKARAPRPIPLVKPPDAAALASLPRPVRACPDCGFIGIRPSRMEDGVLAGAGEMMSSQSCPHCGYHGPPAEFDAPEDYAEYVESLQRAWRPK